MSTIVEVRERPILFSGAMIRAILEGRKSQTRRVVKGEALRWLDEAGFTPKFVADPDNGLSPYGQPGDRLWVREAWNVRGLAWGMRPRDASKIAAPEAWVYAASADGAGWTGGWRPSIHMPRAASRITLELTDVRVERVQEITEEDARAEGAPMYVVGHGPITAAALAAEPGYFSDRLYRNGFEDLWDSINARRGYGWDANPWVWVVGFRVLAPTPALERGS